MSLEYGCNVTNKFGLISDDEEYEDPQELKARVAQIAAQKKEDKPVAKPVLPVKEETKTINSARTEGGRGRGGRGRGRGGAGRPPRDGEQGERFGGENRRGGPRRGGERGAGRPFRGRGGNTNNASSEVSPAKENSFEENHDNDAERTHRPRGGFSLGGRGGGGRGGRGRQYDRQSGSDRTGVRSMDKKDGHGKGNWGGQKDELTGETENIAPTEETQEPEVPREKTAEELAFEAEQAELAKQKTLKEFRATSAVEAPKFNTRKAGEGGENFGKLVPIKKEIIPDREEDEIVVIKKEPRKQVLDINIKFADSNRGGFRNDRERGDRGERGERQGRGGPRSGGRGGRGGNRGHTNAFDASSEAFPALGAN